jgi:putative transposase
MSPIYYRPRRFPRVIIQHAVWLHTPLWFELPRVEELLAQRGLNLSYETVATWSELL